MLFDDGFEVQFFHQFETDSFSDPTLSEPSQPLLHAGGPLQNGGARFASIGDQAADVAQNAAGLREWRWGSGLSHLDHPQEFGGALGARLLGLLAEEFLYDQPRSPDAGSAEKDSIALAGETIVVTGTRPPPYDPYTDGSEGNGPGYSDNSGDSTSIETGEGSTCGCAGMTEAEKREQAIDAEVAKVLEDILKKADQAMEYGSLIWIDSNGSVQHTPLISTPDEKARIDSSALPRAADGITPDWSVVVAMVHSHPRYIAYNNQVYYDSGNPDYLLYPWSGDWASYDGYANNIGNAGGNVSAFTQFIIGWDGTKFVISEYDAADRGTNTSNDGEAVDSNTEACTC